MERLAGVRRTDISSRHFNQMTNAAFLTCTAPLLAPGLVSFHFSAQGKSGKEHRVPEAYFVPLSASFAGVTRISHTPPPSAGLPWKRSALLWIRIGHFRLADNAAVRTAALFAGTVLPIVTIQRKELSDGSISAIAALRSGFQAVGSTVVVRVVDDFVDAEIGAVRNVAHVARAKWVLVNGGLSMQYRTLDGLHKAGLSVRACGEISVQLTLSSRWPQEQSQLCNPPRSFPRLPNTACRIPSNLYLNDSNGQKGEAAGRRKLARLLEFRELAGDTTALLSYVLRSLDLELYLGCVSRARVLYEFRCRRFANAARQRNGLLHSITSFFHRFSKTPALASLSIAAYDVNGSDRRGVEWDEETKSFRLKEWEHKEPERRMTPKERWNEFWRRRRMFLTRSFFPDDVTPDYYSFTAWRVSQRCVSATIGVFGTSSLLFALGIRSGRIGQAAVISWVLKDGLGRVGKMLWAGSMGKDFDVDPKRWRFRSALLYAFGNGLEIVTQIFPASFLVFATLANSMKQVSMLTSSATRNAMYRSFGGRSQNIANITAKGEAQIVVADLIGMACGIRLSKILGASKEKILGVYLALTVLDIFGIYMELRQVVFRTLNAERSNIIVNHYVRTGKLLAPSDISPQERIFLKPRYKAQVRLSSIANAAKDPKELDLLLHVFRREHFLVTTPISGTQSACRLVLRKNASNADVLRAILMIGYVHKAVDGRTKKGSMTLEEQETILRSARKYAKRNFPMFLEAAKESGWSTENLLFSTLKRRGYWGHQHS